MTIGMMGVRLLRGHPHPDNHNKRTEYIRSRMNRVGYHCSGSAKDPGQKLSRGQNQVDNNADFRHPHGNFFTTLHTDSPAFS